MNNQHTEELVPLGIKASGLAEITRILEEAIDLVKTKQGDARVILVGGGSIVVTNHIAGVGEIIRPKYLEVANAVGAAVYTLSLRLSRQRVLTIYRFPKSAAPWTK